MRDKTKDNNFKDSLRVALRVQEAKKRDIGRNIARIDQETMDKLDIKTADIISLIGKKETDAIAWPSYPQDSWLGIVRIDSRLIKNAGTSIDETIQIRKVITHTAQNIVLAPISIKIKSNPRFETFVKRKLTNYPVAIDDFIFISIGISREVTFKVISLKPSGICTIKPETVLYISEEITEDKEQGADYVTFEYIGGLHHEIEEIRDIVEIPLRHPSLINKLGITPQRGILLSGPPGCGKTLLARAVANESEAYILFFSGPEIIQKYHSETEKKLRNIFIEAEEKAPSIIIIDEIDSIAPRKELVLGKWEHRMVSQLLSLLDGFNRRGVVIVIGLTNKLELLEPALLSPGRFDKIIEINLPEEKGRDEIFRIHTRNMPLEKSVSIRELAESTQNFSGADISGVCKEASLFALKRYLPQIDLDCEIIDPELLEQIEIIPNDFYQALKKISKNVKLRQKLMENDKTKENNNKKI